MYHICPEAQLRTMMVVKNLEKMNLDNRSQSQKIRKINLSMRDMKLKKIDLLLAKKGIKIHRFYKLKFKIKMGDRHNQGDHKEKFMNGQKKK